MSVQAFINGSWTVVADVVAPPGIINMFGGAFTQVSGVYIGPNTGWLACNGQTVSRTIYAGLFQAIGTTWGVGDGVTTFNVPDMQEASPAGAGQSTRTEVSHDNFSIAQFSDDQIQGHYHSQTFGVGSQGNSGTFAGGPNPLWYNITIGAAPPSADPTHGTPRVGSVTRGKRIWINFVIKT